MPEVGTSMWHILLKITNKDLKIFFIGSFENNESKRKEENRSEKKERKKERKKDIVKKWNQIHLKWKGDKWMNEWMIEWMNDLFAGPTASDMFEAGNYRRRKRMRHRPAYKSPNMGFKPW